METQLNGTETKRKNFIERYFVSFMLFSSLFLFLSFYLFLRRGYFDLFIANKVFAGASVIMLGLILLVGPGSQMFPLFKKLFRQRRELGMIAFILSLIHVIVSLFFLPSKFPPLSAYLQSINWPFIFGLTAIITLAFLFFISNDRVMKAVNTGMWWKAQRWGVRIAFILIALHVFIMKWRGWVTWYRAGGGSDLVRPHWPGAGILVGWFIFIVIFLRLIEYSSLRLNKSIWKATFISLLFIYVITFIRGYLN